MKKALLFQLSCALGLAAIVVAAGELPSLWSWRAWASLALLTGALAVASEWGALPDRSPRPQEEPSR